MGPFEILSNSELDGPPTAESFFEIKTFTGVQASTIKTMVILHGLITMP